MPARLTVRRPSPTTAQFTVSNAPSRRTWPAKIGFCAEVFLRIFIFISVLFLDASKLRHSVLLNDGGFAIAKDVWATPIGSLACRIADQYPWSVVAGLSTVLIYAVWRKGYTGKFKILCF